MNAINCPGRAKFIDTDVPSSCDLFKPDAAYGRLYVCAILTEAYFQAKDFIMKRIIILLVLAPVFCYSEIVTGLDTLYVNQGIDFEENAVVAAAPTLEEEDRFDFGVIKENVFETNGCSVRIASAQKLSFCNVPADSVDFSRPVHDQEIPFLASIAPVICYSGTCAPGPSPCQPGTCVYSSASLESPDKILASLGKAPSGYRDYFFTILTDHGKYVLIQPLELFYSQTDADQTPGENCISGISFKWQLQTDGTSRFNSPVHVQRYVDRGKRRELRPTDSKNLLHNPNEYILYSIQGRRIGSKPVRKGNFCSGVYIHTGSEGNFNVRRDILLK